MSPPYASPLEAWACYSFKNRSLVRACHERAHSEFQRLEFLGDRVLTMILGTALFRQFPEDNEGALSKRYAYLASSRCMHDIGVRSGLLPLLLAANTEPISEKRLVAEAIEAIVGAVYLDGGMAATNKLVLRLWRQDITQQPQRATADPKSCLQEWTMQNNKPMPTYNTITATKPGSLYPTFIVEVSIGDKVAQAQAGKKQDAEKQAAALLLETLLTLKS